MTEIICETNGEWTIETEYILRNDTETKKRLVKCKVLDDNNKWINAYDVWMSSLSQELRHGIDFRPDQRDKTDDNMMNTFFGFKADIDGQHKFIDKCDPTKINHILDLALNLCGNNNDQYEYLLDWLAFPLQEGKKTAVALLVKGLPGCGKGMFFNELMGKRIYGNGLFTELSGGKQLFGNFNDETTNKMLVMCDEIVKFSKNQADMLKNCITEDTKIWNRKMRDSIVVQDFTNFVLTCNHFPDGLIEPGDRRYFVLEANATIAQNHEYFTKVMKQIEDDGHIHFYQFLLERDIKVFKLGEAPPQTDIKFRLRAEAIDPVWRYLRSVCEKDELPVCIPNAIFYDRVKDFCDKERIKPKWKDKSGLLKVMREGLPNMVYDKPVCVQKSDGTWTTTRCITFPDRAEYQVLLATHKLWIEDDEYGEAMLDEEMEKLIITKPKPAPARSTGGKEKHKCICDECGIRDFTGIRYRSITTDNVDLCTGCFKKQGDVFKRCQPFIDFTSPAPEHEILQRSMGARTLFLQQQMAAAQAEHDMAAAVVAENERMRAENERKAYFGIKGYDY